MEAGFSIYDKFEDVLTPKHSLKKGGQKLYAIDYLRFNISHTEVRRRGPVAFLVDLMILTFTNAKKGILSRNKCSIT